jgi:hypothetical protein
MKLLGPVAQPRNCKVEGIYSGFDHFQCGTLSRGTAERAEAAKKSEARSDCDQHRFPECCQAL